MMPSVDPQSVQAAPLLKSLLPSDWSSIRLKFLLATPITDGPHLTPEFTLEGFPFLSVDGIQYGELVFEDCRYVSEEDHREFSKKAAPQRDDILLGKAASTGKIARVKVDTKFSIWSPLALIRADTKKISSAFLEHCLKSTLLQSQIDDLCSSNTQKNISMGDIPRLTLPLPTLDAQESISRYLDRETARIDGLIAEKERMLALLEEKCVALISHAVTRGLDPNAPLKPSGQEWLGEIPAHWDLLPLRWFMHIGSGEFLSNESISSEKTDEMQIPVVGGNGVLGYSILENTQDALVIGRVGALCGNVHFFDGPLWVTDNALLVELASRFDPKYMREVLKLMKLNSLANQSAQPLITGETIKAQKVPAPSSQEQEDIFRFLEDKYIVHELLSDELKNSVHLLKERRAALITAAVTGQIPLEEMDG
jgi:type I restriction enzyme S subunit